MPATLSRKHIHTSHVQTHPYKQHTHGQDNTYALTVTVKYENPLHPKGFGQGSKKATFPAHAPQPAPLQPLKGKDRRTSGRNPSLPLYRQTPCLHATSSKK